MKAFLSYCSIYWYTRFTGYLEWERKK